MRIIYLEGHLIKYSCKKKQRNSDTFSLFWVEKLVLLVCLCWKPLFLWLERRDMMLVASSHENVVMLWLRQAHVIPMLSWEDTPALWSGPLLSSIGTMWIDGLKLPSCTLPSHVPHWICTVPVWKTIINSFAPRFTWLRLFLLRLVCISN